MIFRVVLGVVLVVGAAFGWFVAAGPSLMLGSMKNDYVAAAEASGIDVSKCKAREKTILDPSGGMAMCVQDVYGDVKRQLEAERYAPGYAELGGSHDEPQEAPRQEEPSAE